jgi:hypothetical protein
LAVIRRPLAIVQAERLVVVGQATQLDLLEVAATGCSRKDRSVVAQLGCGGQVGGVAEGLVARPAARMVGGQAPVAPDPDAVQVGVDLDAAADCGGVH